MAHAVMVPCSEINDGQATGGATSVFQSFVPASIPTQEAPTTKGDNSSCLFVVRQKLASQGLSFSQYKTSLKKWIDFCENHAIHIFQPSVPKALEFLVTLFHNGASYSTVNTARSAVSSILLFGGETPFGQLPIIKHFMKGVYELRPNFPKQNDIWDLKVIFDYFRTHDSTAKLA
eukprot:gene6608-7357_t